MLQSEWESAPLGELACFLSGGTPHTQRVEYWGGDIPWVSAKDMKSFVIRDAALRLTNHGAKSGTRMAPEGSVLILVRGMTLLKDLPVGYVEREVAFNQDIKALVPNKDISGKYLAYAILAAKEHILQLVNVAGHGTGRLDTTLLKGFEVAIPPLPEQRCIAAILSTWDHAIDLATQLIAAKQQRKRGLMQQLLTGQRRFAEFSEGRDWQEGELIQFLELQRGFDLPVNDRESGDVKIIASNGCVGFHNISKVKGPGVVTGRSGTIGKVIFEKDDFWPLNTTLYVKDFKGNDPLFVYYFLVHMNLERFSNGTGVPTLNRNDIHPCLVTFPPLHEQRRIAAVLQMCDLEITLLKRKRDLCHQQKQGLMQQLLTGRVRVNVDSVAA